MRNRHSLILAFPFLLLVAFLCFPDSGSESTIDNTSNAVNAVIGDESYIEVFGEAPGEIVPESIRILTHLKYVEKRLRERSIDHLSPDQKKNRARYLDLLKAYYRAGAFPHNDGHPDSRRPTFIDKKGNICAVGYMVAHSAGWEVAERINKKYKYAYIPEIDDPVFKRWARNSGFTITELAMIQPKYGGNINTTEIKRNENRMGLSYGLTSGFLASVHAVYLTNKSRDPWLIDSPTATHWLGLAAGTGSIVLGALNLDNRKTYAKTFCGGSCTETVYTETNHLRTGVSIANIGVGAFNVVRGVYHLVSPKRPESSNTQVELTYMDPGGVAEKEPIPAVQFRVNF